MHPNVCNSIIYNSQIMKRAQMSIDWWMDKEDVVYICMCMYTYIYNGILLSHQKMQYCHLQYYKWELECTMLSKISQRKTNTIWFHSYVEFKKQKKNEYKEKEREREREANQETDSWLQRTNWGLPEGRWEGAWVERVIGMKEGTCHDEHRVLYGEALNH